MNKVENHSHRPAQRWKIPSIHRPKSKLVPSKPEYDRQDSPDFSPSVIVKAVKSTLDASVKSNQSGFHIYLILTILLKWFVNSLEQNIDWYTAIASVLSAWLRKQMQARISHLLSGVYGMDVWLGRRRHNDMTDW